MSAPNGQDPWVYMPVRRASGTWGIRKVRRSFKRVQPTFNSREDAQIWIDKRARENELRRLIEARAVVRKKVCAGLMALTLEECGHLRDLVVMIFQASLS